jgi:hypothetical protein
MDNQQTPTAAPRPRTARQRAASARNGAKSRGPHTPEGKLRSSKNAISHGILSKDLLLPGESRERFDELNARILQRLNPQDDVELSLIQSFVMACWRQRRIWDLEAVNFNAEIAAHAALPTPLAAAKAWNALVERSGSFRALHRYEGRQRRDMSRSLFDLHLIRNVLNLVPDSSGSELSKNDETNLTTRNPLYLQCDSTPSEVPSPSGC